MTSAASAVALAEAVHRLLGGPLTPFTYGQVVDLLHAGVGRDRSGELLAAIDRVRAGEPGAIDAIEEADELEQILLRQLVVDQSRLEAAWAHHTGSEDDWAFSEVRFAREQHADSGAIELRLQKRGGGDVTLRMPPWSLANLLAKLGTALETALAMEGFTLDDEPKRVRLLDTIDRLQERLRQTNSPDSEDL